MYEMNLNEKGVLRVCNGKIEKLLSNCNKDNASTSETLGNTNTPLLFSLTIINVVKDFIYKGVHVIWLSYFVSLFYQDRKSVV